MWNSNSIQRLEDDIMKAWGVVDELDLLIKHFGDHPRFEGLSAEANDEMINVLIGVKELYSIKFENMWTTYELVVKDFYKYKRIHDNEE